MSPHPAMKVHGSMYQAGMHCSSTQRRRQNDEVFIGAREVNVGLAGQVPMAGTHYFLPLWWVSFEWCQYDFTFGPNSSLLM